MHQINVIALITFREVARKKLFYLLILSACLLLVNVKFLSIISPSAEQQFIMDLGFTTIIFLGVLLILFTAANAIPIEIEKKTVYHILTYPVKRYVFILGKVLGITLILFVAMLAWGGLLFVTFWLVFHTVSPELPAVLAMVFLQLLVLVAISMWGSTFLTRIVNILFSALLFFTGHFISYITFLADKTENLFLRKLITFFSVLLPDFEAFNERVLNHFIVHGHIDYRETWPVIGGYIIYCAVLILLTLLIFRRKEV